MFDQTTAKLGGNIIQTVALAPYANITAALMGLSLINYVQCFRMITACIMRALLLLIILISLMSHCVV
jgi:hypothetical protein